MKRVVITGIGTITPIGNSIAEFKDGLEKGLSGANLITLFDATLFKTKFACEVKGFVAEDRLDRKDARRLDRFTQFAMVASADAILDSGLNLV